MPSAIIGVVLLAAFLGLSFCYLGRQFHKNGVKKYLKHHPYQKRLILAEQFFNSLYAGINPVSVSCKERDNLGLDDDACVYGEIQFLPFFALLDKVEPRANEVFYDLGSGAGKAVLAAALCFDFSRLCGIEMLPALSQLANEQVSNAKCMALREGNAIFLPKLDRIQFINDNFLHLNFSDADVVFITATCYHYSTWEKLIDKLIDLKPGSRVIVITKKIQNEKFKLICQSRELMSWGISSVYIYVRVV